MSFNYQKARASAGKNVANFGQPSKFYSLGETTTDMLGNTITIAGEEIQGIISPKLAYSAQEIQASSSVKNSESGLIAGDSYVFFHSDIEPSIGMLTDLNNETLRVVSIEKIDSVDNINVYRKLQLRG